MPSYPSGFYVYMLVDPKTGITFYIGKGQRDRAWQHARAVGRGDLSGNARKVAKIQEILTRGDEVEIQIVAEYDLENDALEHEFELVDSMVELTNIMPGGGGRSLSPEEIGKRVLEREKRIQSQMIDAFEKRHAAKIEKAKGRIMLLRGSDRHKAEIDAWFAGFSPDKSAGEDIIVAVRDRRVRVGERQAFIKLVDRPHVRDKSLDAKIARAENAKRKKRLRCL